MTMSIWWGIAGPSSAYSTQTCTEGAIKTAQFTRINLQEPIYVLIFPTVLTPTAAIWQSLGVVEWLHLAHSPQKALTPFHDSVAQLVIKGRTSADKGIGSEPSIIVILFSIQRQSWLWQSSDTWQTVFANFPGQVESHYPHNKIVQFAIVTSFVFPKIVHAQPIATAVTVFTDGSSSGKAGFYSHAHIDVVQTFILLHNKQSFDPLFVLYFILLTS